MEQIIDEAIHFLFQQIDNILLDTYFLTVAIAKPYWKPSISGMPTSFCCVPPLSTLGFRWIFYIPYNVQILLKFGPVNVKQQSEELLQFFISLNDLCLQFSVAF
jgi:hypothetical protein